MYQTGSIDLHRKSMSSTVWADDVLWKAWSACLMLAYYHPYEKPIGNNQVLKLEPGQFTTGQFSFYVACYPDERNRPISSRTLWRKLFLLEKLGNLSIETSNKFSIVTVTNWAIYQPEFKGFVKPFDQDLSSACQADVKHVSTHRRNIKDKEKEALKTLAENPAPAVKDDKPKEKPKRKTTFPQDFALTDKLREYAKVQGYHNDLDRLFEDFRIHHCSKGTVHLDWGLALMKWVRNEVSWGKGGAQPIPPSKPGEPGNVFANVPEYAHLKYADDDPAFHEWRERERQANERAAENA